MNGLVTDEMIYNDLADSCNRYFGINITNATPIKRGYLNLKWKIETDSGVFLIKQYNKERYQKYNHGQLLHAFSQQERLYEKGLPCPKLYSHEEQYLIKSEKGELFQLMNFCNGSVLPPGQLNVHQMYELGRVTGYMHYLLNNGTQKVKSYPEFIPPSREARLTHWKAIWNQANREGKLHLLPIMETHYNVTETIELSGFDLMQTGWAHRDLWVDNLLFEEKTVSAILDFDRMKYDYPQLDVARALISGALHEEDLNVSLVQAFIEGYREYHSLGKRYVTSALRMLWYMESTWWIDSTMDQRSGPPKRFVKEMRWLAEKQHELESMLGGL